MEEIVIVSKMYKSIRIKALNKELEEKVVWKWVAWKTGNDFDELLMRLS